MTYNSVKLYSETESCNTTSCKRKRGAGMFSIILLSLKPAIYSGTNDVYGRHTFQSEEYRVIGLLRRTSYPFIPSMIYVILVQHGLNFISLHSLHDLCDFSTAWSLASTSISCNFFLHLGHNSAFTAAQSPFFRPM
jgi:hypothetical protein